MKYLPYILAVVAVIAIVYYFFFRKKEAVATGNTNTGSNTNSTAPNAFATADLLNSIAAPQAVYTAQTPVNLGVTSVNMPTVTQQYSGTLNLNNL